MMEALSLEDIGGIGLRTIPKGSTALLLTVLVDAGTAHEYEYIYYNLNYL